MIVKFFLILLVHLVFFVAYPYTGPMGQHYIWVSALLWCGLLLFLGVDVFFNRFLGALLGNTVIIVFFIALIFCLATTMPQRDNVSVLRKLQRGIYPDRTTIYYGLLRVGVHYDALMKNSYDFETEVKKAVEKIK